MDEDQEICRVCRCESTHDHPLFHPCKCSGSIRFVHQDCLLEWLSHSKKKYCELCEHPFSFTPIYRDDMPERIPLGVLLQQCTHRLGFLLKISLRATIVAVVWLVFLPYGTLWTWRFYFWSGESIMSSKDTVNSASIGAPPVINETLPVDVKSMGDQSNLRDFLADCFEGQIITAFVIVVFVAAYLFREWVVQNTHANPDIGPREAEEEELDEPPQDRRERAMEDEQHPPTQRLDVFDSLPYTVPILTSADFPPDEQRDREALRAHIEDFARRQIAANYELYATEGLSFYDVHPINDEHDDRSQSSEEIPTLRRFNDDGYEHRSANESWRHNTRSGQSSSRMHSNSEPPCTHELERHSSKPKKERIDGPSNSRPRDMTTAEYTPHDHNTGSSTSSRESFSSTWREERKRAESEEPSSAKLRWRAPEFPIQFDDGSDFTDGPHEESSGGSRESSVEPVHAAHFEDEHDELHRHHHHHQEQNANREMRNNRNEEDAAMEDEEVFNLGEDIDGVLEAIGMRGNPWMLLQNSVLMTLMISLCLGVAIWIPYIIGRLVILIRPVSFIQTPVYLMRLVTDPVIDFVLDKCLPSIWSDTTPILASKGELFPKSWKTTVYTLGETIAEKMGRSWSLVDDANVNTMKEVLDTVAFAAPEAIHPRKMDWRHQLQFLQDKTMMIMMAVVNRWHQFATGQSGLDRSVCTVVGYIVLICAGSWYLARKNGTAHRGASTSVNEIIRQQGVFLKVFFFIVLELVVFPTICGVLLDVATLPLFEDASLHTRWEFTYHNPYSGGFLHWFIGTGFMFQFAVFVTLCREIVRPGVMWFIRDPNDPQFHPVQEIIERPILVLLRKICSSVFLYLTLIVVGIGSVTLAASHLAGIYPLRWTFDAPLSTLALDFLAIQFLLPPLVHFIEPRALSKMFLHSWWRVMSRHLRLTSFMFNGRHPEEEGVHVRKTWKAWFLRQKAPVPSLIDADVAVSESNDHEVEFVRDGHLARVLKHDIVPVHAHRRMIVPVDPVTLEAIDETERRQGHPAASESGGEEHNTTIVYVPPQFKARVILFLILMWLSGSVLTCAFTVTPVLLGRHVFETYLTPGKETHDIYAFAVGLYITVLMSLAINWVCQKMDAMSQDDHKPTFQDLTQYITTKLKLALKVAYLTISYCFAMPFLLGIAVDLYIFMPIRYSKSSEALVLHLSEDWSFGIVYMSLFWGIVYVLPNNALQREMTAIFGNDITEIDAWRMTRKIIAPVSIGAVCAIIIPGVLTWGAIQSLAVTDSSLHLLMFRCAYPIIFCSAVAIGLCILSVRVARLWVRSVRDETYLVGKRLHNFDVTS